MKPLTHPAMLQVGERSGVSCEEMLRRLSLSPPKYPCLVQHTQVSPSKSLLWTLKNFGFLWSPMKASWGHNPLEGATVQLGAQVLGTRPQGKGLGTDGEEERALQISPAYHSSTPPAEGHCVSSIEKFTGSSTNCGLGRHFPGVSSLKLHNNPTKLSLFLPFYRWRNGGTERLSVIPGPRNCVTEPGAGPRHLDSNVRLCIITLETQSPPRHTHTGTHTHPGRTFRKPLLSRTASCQVLSFRDCETLH